MKWSEWYLDKEAAKDLWQGFAKSFESLVRGRNGSETWAGRGYVKAGKGAVLGGRSSTDTALPFPASAHLCDTS